MVASAENAYPLLGFNRLSVPTIPPNRQYKGRLTAKTPEEVRQRTLDILSEVIDILDADDF